MAFDEKLAGRIRKVLEKKRVSFEEKKMMGGLCFMVNDKMCLGVQESKIMARIDPEIYENALKKTGCKEMNFTGKPMKGFVYVEEIGISKDSELTKWIQLCLDFNPKAKSSKKKKVSSKKKVSKI